MNRRLDQELKVNGIQLPEGRMEDRTNDEIVLPRIQNATKRNVGKALLSLYEQQWESLSANERQKCPWPTLKGALLHEGEHGSQALWYVARTLQRQGLLFNIDRRGRPLFADRDAAGSFLYSGRSYTEVQKELENETFQRRPEDVGTRMLLFPIGEYPGDTSELSPEIKAYERFFKFVPDPKSTRGGSRLQEVWLDSQGQTSDGTPKADRNKAWVITEAQRHILRQVGQKSTHNRHIGAKRMLELTDVDQRS